MAEPTGPYAERSKDGWSSLSNAAKTACRINGTFGPILRSKWSGSAPVIALLDALDALCPLIIPAGDAVHDAYTGGTNEPIDSEGEQTFTGRFPDADPI